MDNIKINEFLKLAVSRDPDTLYSTLSEAVFSGAKIEITEAMKRSYGRLRNHLILLNAANTIADTINQQCILATARIRSGLKENLLFPMATLPVQLGSYFLEPGHYSGFEFNANALGLAPNDSIRRTDSNWWASAIELGALSKNNTQFGDRIRDFLDNVSKAPERYGLRKVDIYNLMANGTCLLFGGCKEKFDDAQEDAEQNFHYFCALYFLPRRETGDEPIQLDILDIRKTIVPVVHEMFFALNESSQDDMEGFEREGLSVVSELIPALSDPHIAPSDVIAHFLERMKDILQAHTLGIEGKHTWMRFVAINTVLGSKTATLSPRFHIFPHIDTTGENAVGSFLLAHPGCVSTVKVMVYLWAQTKGVRLSESFEAMFKNLDLATVSYDSNLECVCISEDDDNDLWKIININVAGKGRETRCTLGFIIEKKFDDLTVPFAAIVFESDIPDAFSKRDVIRFRSVVRACSELFIALQIANTSFDLNWGIREAYAERSKHRAIGNIQFGRFLFEILRLDKKVLDGLINDNDARIWKALDGNPADGIVLTNERAKKYILDPLKDLKGTDDECARTIKGEFFDFSEILRERNNWIATHEDSLYKTWKTCPCAHEVYDFLTHVPSNIVWHCYLNAIPRAISDRTATRSVTAIGNGNNAPQFKVMQQHGGLSAMAMFVFTKGSQELRQIIKLSSREKIQAELKNYLEYVRYKVPLSARLPSSGVAFEGDGSTKEGESNETRSHIKQSKSSCGALVSDLIAGVDQDSKPPVTFVMQVAHLIWERAVAQHADASKAEDVEKDVVAFENAISYQFEYNTKRWRSDPIANKWASTEGGTTGAVRQITRIQAPDSKDSLDILREWSRNKKDGPTKRLKKLLEELCGGSKSVDNTLSTLSQYDSIGSGLAAADAGNMGAIIHGDLNCRNLVWSQDYLKYFMIDFEKVGVGFEGADQLRLIFSLLADLTDDGYLKEGAGYAFDENSIKERNGEINALINDLFEARSYLKLALHDLQQQDSKLGKLWSPPVLGSTNGICARAIKKMFESDAFSKGTGLFWMYAARMSAAKQFEYALRGVDGSCFAPLKKMINKGPNEDDQWLNFYNYFTDQELKDRKHDYFVLGKISRAVFAYKTLHELVH